MKRKKFYQLAELLYSEDPSLKQDEDLRYNFEHDQWGELQLAVILGRLDKVQDLCKQSPNAVSTLDRDDQSLLLIGAGWGGHLPVLQWLVEQDRSLLRKSGHGGWTPLHQAAQFGHLAVVQWLVETDDSLLQKTGLRGQTPLYTAAFAGHLPIVQWLVAQDKSLLKKKEHL